MSADHLHPETITALADSELAPRDEALAQAHLHDCLLCSRQVLEAYRLRTAVKQAAQCYTPPADVLQRLTAQARAPQPARVVRMPLRTSSIAWGAIAAVLLVAMLVGGLRWRNTTGQFEQAVLDQHLATLSDASQPEVLSSDRHTVKPWFTGKLPYSFNLPEPNTLPPDTTLTGADLTYIQGNATALLLFTIHKHHASVFVSQQMSLGNGMLLPTREGFHFVTANAQGLQFLAVSDVNQGELEALVKVLAGVQ